LAVLKIGLALFAFLALLSGMANAGQSLDAPDRPVFGDEIPKKSVKSSGEVTFETTATIENEKSALVLCSELAAGETESAPSIEDCDRAISEAPDSGDVYYYRGFAYYNSGDYSNAESDFTRAIDRDTSRMAESYFQRGACKEQQRRLRDAAADFKKASELKPDWSAARRKVDEYRWAYE
jgi:tetratricopeptide (TPR) repeat protein